MHITDLPKATPSTPERPASGLFDSELMDLYAALLIVVPLSLFLKSLWS